MTRPAPIPVVILTGGLGSGKTTILRALLEDPGMSDTALVINEFGAVGIDHLLVASAVEATLLLENGCVCCALRGDLIDTLADLLDRRAAGSIPPFRRIVVETSGLADPGPIFRELATARNLAGRAELTRIVTAVDAAVGLAALPDSSVGQIVHADLCIVTKADIAPPIAVDRLCERLRAMNPAAGVEVAREGRIADAPRLFESGGPPVARPAPAHPSHAHDGVQTHAHDGVQSWSTCIATPLPWSRYGAWLELIYSLRPAELLRMKGLIWVTDRDLPVLTQAVGPLVAPLRLMPGWPSETRETRLVVITRNLDPEAVGASFEQHVLSRARSARSDATGALASGAPA